MQRTIAKYMVKSPFVGTPDLSLKSLQALMRECQIRHIPIMENGRLEGLVSELDLREALASPRGAELKAAHIMKTDLFVVQKKTPLVEIVKKMKEEKIGSALVVNDAMDCIGIFTTIDALQMLEEFLRDEDQEPDLYLIENYMSRWDEAMA